LADEIGREPRQLSLVGGSWRAIARLDMERGKYPLHVLHEYRMTPAGLRATLKWIAASDLKKLRARTGISQGRMALVPEAAAVLEQMIRTFEPTGIAMSGYGLREGLLYEQMPDQIRRRDPLIEACHFAEARDGRRPGFGVVLDQFIAPVFAGESTATRRLIKAACLLHDVTWRAHPDFRAEVCFDNATRANLGGLNHHERIWLGLALMHRYKKNRDATKFSHLIELLDQTDIRSAEIVGRAMRFGSMFSGAAPGDVATLKWRPDKAQLSLSLTRQGADLYGEVAAARFKSLAKALGAVALVKVTKP
ncbi:MAG: exopolyphosphatase, partial [Paracoccaceae bacterium]